VKSYNTFLST